MRLRDKVALITGSGSGIGEAMAKRFAAEGAAIAVVDRNELGAEATAAAIRQAGGRAHAIVADVASEDDVRAMLRETLDAFGALHILVNNAAVYVDKDVEDTTEEEWDHVMNINLKKSLVDVQIRIAHPERNERRDSEHRVNGRRACATALDRLLYVKGRSDRLYESAGVGLRPVRHPGEYALPGECYYTVV